MKVNWLSWPPLAVTILLMYFAKTTHLAVLHYNLFVLMLLGWSGFLIFYFRAIRKHRVDSGKTNSQKA